MIYSRCFKLNLYNIYHFVNEFIIALFNVILFVSYIRGITYKSEKFAEICLHLITATWGMNIGFSIIKTGVNLYEKIKAWREKKKSQKSKSMVHKVYPEEKEQKIETSS